MSPGYSGKPLYEKLGIKPGMHVVVLSGPSDYRAILQGEPPGVDYGKRVTQKTDIVHVFETRQGALEKTLAQLARTARPDAAVWVSWPKKASGVATDVTENTIRDAALPLGFVDVKVCAVTDVWSGLKLVKRLDART